MYQNPYEALIKGEGKWRKANFHTHAGTGSKTCGHYPIDEVVGSYRDRGYEVLTISNHDIYSDTSEYAEKYGMTMINGVEYSAKSHMLCIHTKGLILGEHQETIDETQRQGGFVILCHPRWVDGSYWTPDAMDALHGMAGLEIYNGVIFRLNGTGLASDVWDELLTRGRLLWGFGNDDFHRWYDLAKAWNVIYSGQGAENVVDAVKAGCFYVSTGLKMDGFAFDGETIDVRASAWNGYPCPLRYTFVGEGGKLLSAQDGESARYRIGVGEPYVRVHVESPHGAMLWTQPVYDTDRLTKERL